MDDYYKTLGVEEIASKSLIRIAYVTAINYCIQNNLDKNKLIDIHIAYRILKRYRNRLRSIITNNKKGQVAEKIQKIVRDTRDQIDKGRIDISYVPSIFILEFRYIIRSLSFGIFGFLFSIIFDAVGDFIAITMDIRGFFASLIFFFSILNFWGNWISPYYSVLLIVISISLVIWHIKEFERKVIKTIANTP